jgi:hypothetical protein
MEKGIVIYTGEDWQIIAQSSYPFSCNAPQLLDMFSERVSHMFEITQNETITELLYDDFHVLYSTDKFYPMKSVSTDLLTIGNNFSVLPFKKIHVPPKNIFHYLFSLGNEL